MQLLTALVNLVGKVSKQEVSLGVGEGDLSCDLLVPVVKHHHLHCYCLTAHHTSRREVHGHKEWTEDTQLGGRNIKVNKNRKKRTVT